MCRVTCWALIFICTQKTHCCQETKTHMIDFEQLRACILYREQKSDINIQFYYDNSCTIVYITIQLLML